VAFAPPAERALELLPSWTWETPVCMRRPKYSFSDDPRSSVRLPGSRCTCATFCRGGAGFVVALAGDILTMPGLGKNPAAERSGSI